jgi:hypothetical protein
LQNAPTAYRECGYKNPFSDDKSLNSKHSSAFHLNNFSISIPLLSFSFILNTPFRRELLVGEIPLFVLIHECDKKYFQYDVDKFSPNKIGFIENL